VARSSAHPAAVLRALKELRSPAFVVGGSGDEAFNVVEAEALRDRGVEVVVLDGANHGLEVADPAASARLLAGVLDAMRAFVVRAVSDG
jgi:pimeloyl-ACP methyl ester carboxylesterase